MSRKSRFKRMLRRQQEYAPADEGTGGAGQTPDATHEHQERHAHARRSEHAGFLGFFDSNWKLLMTIPLAMLIVALLFLSAKFAMTGDVIDKGVSLKGGVTITIAEIGDLTVLTLEEGLRSRFAGSDLSVRSISQAGTPIGIIIEATDIDPRDLSDHLEGRYGLGPDSYSVETMGSSLGASFFKETIIAVLIAFVFMGIVVILYFKNFVPSVAVILAAFSDIVVTLAVISALGIKLSTGGVAAFLMLIGYSVDTDMLLTTRVLKKKEGSVFERILGAAKTGLTMNVTTMIAISVALIFTDSEVIGQIMTILLIGLFVDIINTWIQNAGILRWYLERKKPE
ncbi:protein translocase subunit SecF [Candidatus Woesearchaeota archaeon]|nr:protein translocase subunit SecF [Candidatus Woesearchaeota archaeon]